MCIYVKDVLNISVLRKDGCRGFGLHFCDMIKEENNFLCPLGFFAIYDV
jgi:hypothetical protein